MPNEPVVQPLNLPTDFIRTVPQTSMELSPKLAQAARLKALGMSGRQICEKLGMSESHLSLQSKAPLFKQIVADLQQEANEAVKIAQNTLIEAAPKAAERLVDLLDSVSAKDAPRLLKEVSVDVLKGAGAIKTESASPQINISVSETKMNVILETIQQIHQGENGGSK